MRNRQMLWDIIWFLSSPITKMVLVNLYNILRFPHCNKEEIYVIMFLAMKSACMAEDRS